MTNKRYEGAAILVSGAARGFGRLAAQQFAAEGARLVLTDILEKQLSETAQLVKDAGAEAVAIAGDVAEEALAEKLVSESVNRFGRLDVALNNAGIAHFHAKLPDIEASTLDRIIRVDLIAVFYAMKYQLKQMEVQGGGTILNVSSVAGITGAPLLSAYSAAKHGVIGLTKSAALEYARSGIRINAICPSFADTPMVMEGLEHMRGTPEEALSRTVGVIPMRRLATPEEVVQAMLWICCPANSFMTGQAIAIDGGLTAV
ncbi:MAG TPA: glucose 1-dehydrogenase [Hyphomicrobiales bacterium]|nr:glucose 1-dehydrogenase [Hyphomicrobiales bacterium]